MTRNVGLDVHKRVVESCILDDAGKRIRRDRFALTREGLDHFATKILSREDRVVLEATNTWTVVRLLKPHVAEVIVSNPLIDLCTVRSAPTSRRTAVRGCITSV